MSDSASGGPGRARGIRVAVRVRPVTELDANSDCDMMNVYEERKEVLLQNQADPKKGRRFVFDSVFGTEASQVDVYRNAGIPELVEAAVGGYHATVFAYGQTGSGKTFTMEGTKYNATAPSANSKYSRGGGPGATITADFDATPEQQMGVIPRAVDDVFESIGREATSRRFSVRCSFVQIYKEQVYDLLNPRSLATPPGTNGANTAKELPGFGSGKRNIPGQPPGFGGALRMRWSKTEDFYLENLFKCECQTGDELMNMFRSGIQNKIMASHKLNANSSRSHCLLTIYIDSSPLASPNEVISSRLTLVDLAGSERGSATGATEGRIRDEGVAINKSLFTLRHVITTLTAAAESGNTGNTAHIPYRDSKLTSLLKNSLGGNSLTTMIACLAPLNTHYEENVSTLEYASRANRITNQVAVNEDPKSRIIRELRAEVAFLRQQLAAVQTAQPGLAAMLSLGGIAAPAGSSAGDRISPVAGYSQQPQPSQRPDVQKQLQQAQAQLAPDELATLEDMKQRIAQSVQQDVDTLATKLIEAIGLVQKLSQVNQQLRSAYDAVSKSSEQYRIDNDSLQIENAQLRDKLSIFEGMASLGEQQQQLAMEGAAGPSQPHGSPGSKHSSPQPAESAPYYTASSATYIELQELRKENALLHDRLGDSLLAPSNNGRSISRGHSSSRSRSKGGGAPGTSGSRRPISTSRASSMGAQKNGVPSPPPFTSPQLFGPGSPMHPARSGTTIRFERGVSAYGGAASSPYSPTAVSSNLRMLSMSRPVTQPELNGAGGHNLAEVHHQVTSRALVNNVRMSTVGQMLPNAAALRSHTSTDGMSPGGATLGHSGSFSAGSFAGALAQDPPSVSAPYNGPDDDHANKLQHLMSARNALARTRIADASPSGSPQSGSPH